MTKNKRFLSLNVVDAATERIFDSLCEFSSVCVSFSGGKDSSVLLHLTAKLARIMQKKIDVLFVDWEVQFDMTIKHVIQLRDEYQDVIEHFYWIALPLTTVNATSQIEPLWTCWARGKIWFRSPPSEAISDETFFDFYDYGMTFESFTREFARWYARNRHERTVVMTGIRADESLTRFNSISNRRKKRYRSDWPWTTGLAGSEGWLAHPIYDWKIADIWLWAGQNHCVMNPLYEVMYKAGMNFRNMRICEPYGAEQRQNLWLYELAEPEHWNRLCRRVKGARTARIHAGETSRFYARRQFSCPVGLSWQQFAYSLLNSMPTETREHYTCKLAVYLRWYQQREFPDGIPDWQDKDCGSKDVPSWRRICKVLLGNDFWCRSLCFAPAEPARQQRYLSRIKRKQQEWSVL